MKLIDEWRTAVNKLWSLRVLLFGVFLSLLDVLLETYGSRLPPMLYVFLMMVAAVSRLVKQA